MRGVGPVARMVLSVLAVVLLAGCTESAPPSADAPRHPDGSFNPTECNGVTDDDVATAVGSSTLFTRVVVNEAGCFWQENTAIGSFGVGMGISTWWYRGSDLDVERSLEQKVGRTLIELEVNGNKGFKAYDDNACSVYVAKGEDVITWSVQTVNPAMLPDLCSITDRLAKLSQDRVN